MRDLRNLVVNDSSVLESIGTAEMLKQIQDSVLKIAKKNDDSMARETGIQLSLSEDETKQYMMKLSGKSSAKTRNEAQYQGKQDKGAG